jgi:predicted peroxiredoxin
MDKKKYLFTLTHATTNPMQAIGVFKIISNMKAFDDTIDAAVFLLGEGVQLAKKGVADTISMEMEGKQVNVGELLDLVVELEVKFYVCNAFMPGFGVTKEDLIEGAEPQSSAYLGELLLDGFIPFSLSM